MKGLLGKLERIWVALTKLKIRIRLQSPLKSSPALNVSPHPSTLPQDAIPATQPPVGPLATSLQPGPTVPQATIPTKENPPPSPPLAKVGPPAGPPLTQRQPTHLTATTPSKWFSAEVNPIEERPPRRYERAVVVGVDFGTSSTKVIWQDLSENYFELFRWKPALKGPESVLFPSTVCVRSGALLLGESSPAAGDIWLPSIKLCVLCSQNASVCRCDGLVARCGKIQLPELSSPVSAAAVGSLLLAYTFQQVEERLAQTYPNDEVIPIWNVGCPMDHLDIADSKSSWEKMVGIAMQLRRTVKNPAHMELLIQAHELMETFVMPAERNFFIQPEGMAAVKAFLESPRGSEKKTYAIVDVGAGTTEVSFFFNGGIQSNGGVPRPSYLADTTEPVGGGKFDIELAGAWCCDIETARRRKEQGTGLIPNVPSIVAIRQQYDRTCRKILKARKLVARQDKRFDLFIIGGGGRLTALQQSLTACQLPGEFLREHTRQLTPPPSLRNRADVEAHYDLLANACGLASSLDWEYYPPREVPAMAPQAIGTKPDAEELYPK
jgi:hypothetical protein